METQRFQAAWPVTSKFLQGSLMDKSLNCNVTLVDNKKILKLFLYLYFNFFNTHYIVPQLHGKKSISILNNLPFQLFLINRFHRL